MVRGIYCVFVCVGFCEKRHEGRTTPVDPGTGSNHHPRSLGVAPEDSWSRGSTGTARYWGGSARIDSSPPARLQIRD